ncbi:MAG: hypothetical protein Q7S59_01470 [Sulfurimonas sp.]|nr:hypothetical protein [Sulfurimonas sp.]
MVVKFKMKRLRGFILLFLGLFLFNSEIVAATKAPIEGDFIPSSYEIKSPKKVKVDLQFFLLMPFKKVSVSLIVPKGVTLVRGDIMTIFNDLKTNEVKIVSYAFMVEDLKEKQIWATVKVLEISDAILSKDFLFTINPQQSAHPPAAFIEEGHR